MKKKEKKEKEREKEGDDVRMLVSYFVRSLILRFNIF